MKLVNGWKYIFKEPDRHNVEIRFGVVTVFRLYADFSDREFSLTVFNLRVEL